MGRQLVWFPVRSPEPSFPCADQGFGATLMGERIEIWNPLLGSLGQPSARGFQGGSRGVAGCFRYTPPGLLRFFWLGGQGRAHSSRENWRLESWASALPRSLAAKEISAVLGARGRSQGVGAQRLAPRRSRSHPEAQRGFHQTCWKLRVDLGGMVPNPNLWVSFMSVCLEVEG